VFRLTAPSSSRRDGARIAQRFNAGKARPGIRVPKGRLKDHPTVTPSAVPSGLVRVGRWTPNVETLGYSHSSLRDEMGSHVRNAVGLAWAALLVLLLFTQTVTAVIIVSGPVVHTSLKAASEAAAQDQSLVLLVFSAEWCGPCKELKKKTLSSKEFNEQGGALHIADVDVDAEQEMAREYAVTAVPTLVLLTADNKVVGRRTGFMQTAELLLWLREARERVKEGKWEGTAPGSKLGEFIKKAAAAELDTNDIAKLVILLGEPEPADREAASKLLGEQRELAVLPLIEAMTNSYLGVRIGACELLHKLAPDAAQVNPWQSPAELAETEALLKQWWAGTGRLPVQKQTPQADPQSAALIASAVEAVRGNDPVRRTEAMSSLVSQGSTALPAVREAIKACEKAGDQRSLTLLEDVRWAILVSDAVEERAGGVRGVLARGKGPERQTAATHLARAGRGAIPALAELLNDSDPLVVESAVRALSGIGGKDAIPAMAALLKAQDSNLRMTAAQALGHTKNLAAIKELLTVLDDPNEVVACTALSALEELHSEHSYPLPKQSQPPDITKALKGCLADPRWRVRAAAAEVAGKLEMQELIEDLKALLEDSDGFVVKNALESLAKLNAAPEPDKLLAVAQRQPGLRGDAVQMLVIGGTEDGVKATAELYKNSTIEGRVTILQSLAAHSHPSQDIPAWKPFLAQAAAESDPRLRRAAAEAIAAQPAKVAAELVAPLLNDEDAETRTLAARAVLSVIGGEPIVITTAHGAHFEELVEEMEMEASNAVRKSTPTNKPAATPEQTAAWHTVLVRRAGPTPDLLAAAAIYVTGRTNADQPVLEAALARADMESLARLDKSAGIAAILPRLTWPAGQAVVEGLAKSPALYLSMLAHAQKAAPGLNDFLYDPARFRAAVDPASADELASSISWLLNANQRGFTLLAGTPKVGAVVGALLAATNATWRAAAVYITGLKEDEKVLPVLERAAKDTNAWVRAAAVPGLARLAKDRTALEQRLGPLLADADKRVAARAMAGLLEPETREAAGLDYTFEYFEYEKIYASPGGYSRNGDQRPLATLETKPAFLDQARQRMQQGTPEDAALPALLLAQYGDFTGLDHLLLGPTAHQQKEDELGHLALTGIALSRDPKYLPYVKKLTAAAKQDNEYRTLLQALKGMPGPEARELRLEINKRLRQGSE
jgi:HEAT repeat protein/thioredoxin-like negative regulator of GroEL